MAVVQERELLTPRVGGWEVGFSPDSEESKELKNWMKAAECPHVPSSLRDSVLQKRASAEGGGETSWPLQVPFSCAFPEPRAALCHSLLVLLLAGFSGLSEWVVNEDKTWGLPGKCLRLLSVQGRCLLITSSIWQHTGDHTKGSQMAR